jgi:hypothetical protein
MALLLLGAPGARAQRPDSAQAPKPTIVAQDTVRRDGARLADSLLVPPVTARRAFLYSLAIPGLGQAALDRKIVGGTFFLIEAVAIAITRRSAEDLRLARAFKGDSVPLTYAVDPVTGVVPRVNGVPVVATWKQNGYTEELVKSRKLLLEDWVAVIIFNHLISGADAFVAAQLWDLPARVALRAYPVRGGGAGLAASFRFR